MPGTDETAEKTLRTYANYVQAYALCCEDTAALVTEQDKLLASLEAKVPADLEFIGIQSKRGLLSLKAIAVPNSSAPPALVVVASHWAAIQAYYAVHGFGWAVLRCLGQSYNKRHSVFVERMRSDVLSRYLPRPFNICTRGGLGSSGMRSIEYIGSSVSPHAARELSNLASPTKQNAEVLVCKAVQTTRFGEIDSRCSSKRMPGKPLTVGTRAAVEKDLPDTSFADFLWRMRCRANYENPDMFIYAKDDRYLAERYCESVKNVAATFCRLLWRVLAQATLGSELPSLPDLGDLGEPLRG